MLPRLEREGADHYRFNSSAHDPLLLELMAEYPVTMGSLDCYWICGDCRFSDVARHVECKVFEEFFGNAPDVMAHQYGNYEDASEFILAVDASIPRAVGALRFIRYSDAGFKTTHDISQPPLCLPIDAVKVACGIEDWTRCWDIATVAVVNEHRGQTTGQWVSTALYAHLYALALKRDIDHFIAILDRHAYSQLTRAFAIPFAPIADSPPFNYLGSEHSQATHVRISTIRPHMEYFLRHANATTQTKLKPYFARLLDGTGLPPLIDVTSTYPTNE